MSKKLTLASVKKDVKKYDEKQRVELSNGEYVHIYPHFSTYDMVYLVAEMLYEYVESKKLGLDFEKGINLQDWISMSILYKFADLGIPSDLEKKKKIFHDLLRFECTPEIIAAYPKESLDSLIQTVDNMHKKLTAANNLNTKEAIDQIAKEEIENSEISK